MTKRPNILFLLPDQLRHDYLGCYGADFLATPAIDELASHGTQYQTAISPVPVCVPARASMMSGQSTVANGVIDNLAWLRPDRRDLGIETWPELLSRSGYRTAAIGKMHFYPWDISEGFEHRIIAEDKRHVAVEDDYHSALLSRGYRKQHGREMRGYYENKGACICDLPDDLQVDRWVANRTIDYLDRLDDDRPFAIMVGFPGPHCQYDPPEAALSEIDPARLPAALPATKESRYHHAGFVAGYRRPWADLDYSTLSADQIRAIRHHYAASVQRLDTDVGNIITALRRSGRLENTIVVFSSDHGDYLGDFGMVGKAYFHEPSVRVPLIVADFRNPQGQVDSRQVSLLDLYPSILDWARLAVPAHVQGQILGTASEDRVITGVSNLGVMARSGTHKLVRYTTGVEALFDLRTDPHEQVNAMKAQPEVRARLDLELTKAFIQGLATSFADRAVPEIRIEAPHPYYQRNWHRPYPRRHGCS